MKKHYLFLSTLLVVAAVLVAVVSCKKETQGTLMNNKNESVQTFNPREIEDMNAYLKGFKQKMQSATKGDDEALSLEDAAWHLSSLANYEFGNVNVQFDNIRFDTLYAHVDVTKGAILLCDLAFAYESICNDIERFFNRLNLNEKHLRFIDADIAEDGYTTISLVTTFIEDSKGWDDYHWYFEPHIVDPFIDTIAEDSCNAHFSNDLVYVWNGLGESELERLLNVYEHHNYLGSGHHISFYTKSREYTFDYPNYIDPYGSPSYNGSRLFGVLGNHNYVIPKMDMCYYLDSYLGLGYDYLTSNPIGLYADECPAIWSIETCSNVFYPNHSATYYHKLKVTYCYSHINSSGDV